MTKQVKASKEHGPTALALGMGAHIGLPKVKKKEALKESQGSPLTLMSKALAKHGAAKKEADSGSANTAVLRDEK